MRKILSAVMILAILVIGYNIFVLNDVAKTDKKIQTQTDENAIDTSDLKIRDFNIKYVDNADFVTVENGYIKTSVQLDKIFVNIKDINSVILKYDVEELESGGNKTYKYTFKENQKLYENVVVFDSMTLKCDLFVVYKGLNFRVCENDVYVVGLWIGPC